MALEASMYCIKDFMRPCTFEEPNENITIMPVIINHKFPTARNCAVPACESCVLEIANNFSNNTKNVKRKRRELCLMIKLRLGILFQLIIVFVRLLVVYLLVMGGSHVIVVFK